jgi:hypothetical protein
MGWVISGCGMPSFLQGLTNYIDTKANVVI